MFLRAKLNTSAFYTTTTTMTPQNEYRLYCQQHQKQIPLFHQPWWLDIACGKTEWIGLVSTTHFQGKPAIMPIPIMNKWGIKYINRPMLTTYLGPWWAGFETLCPIQQNKLSQQLWPEFAALYPRLIYSKQTFRPAVIQASAFHLQKHRLGIRYTYRINNIQDHERVYKNFRRSVKKSIRKDAQDVEIKQSEDIKSMYQLVEQIYIRQQVKMPFSFSLLNQLYQKANEQGLCKLLLAHNPAGQPIAGLISFQDHNTIYLVASGTNEEGLQKCAFAKLVWHTITSAPAHIQTLDFCGSMMDRIAKNNATYGAIPHPFLELVKWW